MLAFVNNDPVYKDKCLQENMAVFHSHNFEFIFEFQMIIQVSKCYIFFSNLEEIHSTDLGDSAE